MDANFSETTFKKYLATHRFEYQENFIVGSETNPTDVDFFIRSDDGDVYIDVKEVRDSREESLEIDAYLHIREDIKDLRKKFKVARPTLPVILVAVNLSTNFFTGLTVARALLGDIGIEFDSLTKTITKTLHHLQKGNAILTQKKHKSISGIFVFDLSNQRHCLFINPYADNPIPPNYFPDVREITIRKTANQDEFKKLSDIMFWNGNFRENNGSTSG